MMTMSDLRTIINEGFSDGQSLSSMYEIEDVLLLIDEAGKKIDYYKALKKHRANSIDDKVSSLNMKLEALRNIVLNTMKKVAPNDKTLDFPDIGKVTRRKATNTTVVEDEDKVLEFLDSKGMKDEIVSVSTVEVVDRKKLKSAIKQIEKIGDNIPGTSKSIGSESISITFEKPKAETHDVFEEVLCTDTATEAIDLEALDSLV